MSDGEIVLGDDRFDLIRADAVLPIDGVPVYKAMFDGFATPSRGETCVIAISGTSFKATVVQATETGGTITVHAAGGNGALSQALSVAVEGKGYISFPAHLPLEDLLEEIGVQGTPETITASETFSAARWQRLGGPAAEAASALARAAGLTWRVLGDGRFRMAEETWTEYDSTPLDITSENPEAGIFTASHLFDAADLAPGMSVLGRQIIRVAYSLRPERLRLTATYRTTGPGTIKEAFAGAIARSSAPLGYGGVYEARVAKQHPNGMADVITGLPSVDGADGVVAVPLRIGLARARQIVQEGQRVRLRFEGSALFPAGDPSKPYAEAIEQEQSAARGIARLEDKVRVTFSIETKPANPTGFTIIPHVNGIPDPSPLNHIIIVPGQDEPMGSGTPKVQIVETEAEITTASDEVFLT